MNPQPPDQDQLSSHDINHGQRLVRRFALLNGISVALLMDSMLILYAIRNGVSDSAVAVLVSFIHLTMPLVIVGKALIARIGAARTWGMGWFLRNVSAAVMIVAPFLPPEVPQYARTGVILLGGFGFAAFRAIGLVGNSPLIGEITRSGDRGRFLSGNWVRATTTQMLTLVAVIFLLQYAPETWMFQVVIGFAAVLGMYVGILLSRVPESDVPRMSAQKPLREIFSRVWRVSRMRKLLFAWAASFASFTLVMPFAVITLKNGYGLSDYQALSFTLFTLTGGIVASLVNGIIADRVGPRPLLILYVSSLALIAGYWALAPATFAVVPTALAFFIGGYCKFGVLAASNHYFLDVADGSDRVGSSMILRATSGAVAGLIGSVLGGGILESLHRLGFAGIDIYRNYFRIAILVFVVLIPVVRALDRLDEWPVRRAALLLLQPWRIVRMRRERTHAESQNT
ncbi:MAG: MFS transporter [Alkalispirochaeta sp.]